MKKPFLLSLLIYFLFLNSPAFAESTAIGFSAALSERSSSAYTLYFHQTYDPWASWAFGELAPTAEIGASLWYAGSDHIVGGFLAPGLKFSMFTNEDSPARPFIAGSLGGTVISDDRFDDDNWKMGSHALFRTKGTAGVDFGERFQHRVQGEYTHHSTWGITKNHDSYSTYGLAYNYSF